MRIIMPSLIGLAGLAAVLCFLPTALAVDGCTEAYGGQLGVFLEASLCGSFDENDPVGSIGDGWGNATVAGSVGTPAGPVGGEAGGEIWGILYDEDWVIELECFGPDDAPIPCDEPGVEVEYDPCWDGLQCPLDPGFSAEPTADAICYCWRINDDWEICICFGT